MPLLLRKWRGLQKSLAERGVALDGRKRADIRPGMKVAVVQKKDQRTGTLTEGIVQRILTRSSSHPHGIKVELESGEVGRVSRIP